MAETPAQRTWPTVWTLPVAARLAWPVVVVLVVLFGAALRFHGLDWDQPEGADAPLQMHPDERFISMVSDRIDWPNSLGGYFDTANSPLNPYNAPDTPSFVYGTFPLFLAKGVSTLAGDDGEGIGDSYGTTVVWGRRITALVDTATIALVFALGTVLFDRRVGLAGALLYALAVLPTQLAHFWTTDPYVVFFATAALLLSVLLVRARGEAWPWIYGAGAGACLALAMASKVNAAVLVPVLVLAVGLRIAMRDVPRLGLRWGEGRPGGHWVTDLSVLSFGLVVLLLVFRVAQPYAFEGPNFWDMALNEQWVDDIQRERDFQDGNVDYPPFVQFAGYTPVLRPLEQMVRWGLGPATGIAAWASVAAATVLLFRRRDVRLVLPLVVVAAVMAFQGPRFVAFMRYFVPMYPALCLLAAWGLLALWRAAAGSTELRLPRWRWIPELRANATTLRVIAAAAVGLVFVASGWWALAFQNVYREEHPRIAASRWVYDNIPPGSTITGEFWDDVIPYPMPGESGGQYLVVNTYPYETDSPEKVYRLVYGQGPDAERWEQGLNGADYVAITSNRVRDSVRRLEREYPATIRYYELLDSGELGFELVAHFQVRPSFLGISIDDSSAEESFTVYDHPEVRIYRKTEAWDPERAARLLAEAHPERAVNLLPKQGRTNGLLFTPAEAETQERGGTFADIFDADGFTSRLPWLWWLLWLELAAFATVPALTWLFRALPDRGYGLSKVSGLLAVALTTWMLVAWGGPHFSARLVWAVYAAVLAGGGALGYARRRTLLAELRERWRTWLVIELVFVAVFAFFLGLRYANPDLWYHPQGGEKPMELAFLTAVAKSSTLPPYDPWFAGGVMNYYYMGWFFVAVPMRALRIVPEVGFNIAIPMFAALTAAVGFSVVFNLVALSTRPRLGLRGRRPRTRPAVAAALLGVGLLVFASNLDSAHQWIERLQAINTWGGAWGTGDSAAWDVPVAGELLRRFVRMLAGGVGIAGGLWNWLVEGQPLRPFDWWRASRVHPPQFDITEFPYWSFLFGDLHPHLMGLPFFGLVIALCAAYVLSVVRGLRSQGWVLAAGLGLLVGLERTLHTWDFPTAAVLMAAAIAGGQLLRRGPWQERAWTGVGHLALAGGVLVVAFVPYTARFEVSEAGLVRARETTQVHQHFVHFGLFFAFGLAFLALRTYEELRAREFRPGRNLLLSLVAGRWELAAIAVFLAGLTAFTRLYGLATLALSIVALAFFANLLWLEFRAGERHVPRIIVTALFAAGIGVSAGVDVVTLKNDVERMNTVFKFGLQAWQLFALASAYAAWYVGRALWSVRGWNVAPRPGRSFAAWSCAVVAMALLLASSLYLWPGTRARQQSRFADTGPTLDGLAYLEHGVFMEDAGTESPADDQWIILAEDEPLIRWLRENVEGSPVIVEAVGPLYHWTGRISMHTGLPAVVGWDWHEIAHRMAYAHLVQERRIETQAFFRDPDIAAAEAYLRKYNVSYVIVGTEELVFGTPEGIAKFDEMEGLTEVFRSGPYRIYEVAEALRNSPPPIVAPLAVVGPTNS